VYLNDAKFAILRKRRTAEGFLDVWGVAAKVGALDYPEKGLRVWVPPSTLAGCVDTLAHAVLTLEHPDTPHGVDPSNVREYQVGHVAEAAFDEASGELRVRVRITDAAAIRAAEKDEAAELSPGYDVQLAPTSAAYPEAQAAGCDYVQTSRVVNHLALTSAARGGPTVRLRTQDSRLPTMKRVKKPAATKPKTNDASPEKDEMSSIKDELAAIKDMLAGMSKKDSEEKEEEDSEEEEEEDSEEEEEGAYSEEEEEEDSEEEEPPAKPKSKDSRANLSARAAKAAKVAAKIGADLSKCKSVDSMERACARKLVGDSLPAKPSPAYLAGILDSALASKTAKPKTPTTSLNLRAKDTAAQDSAASFEEQLQAKYAKAPRTAADLYNTNR